MYDSVANIIHMNMFSSICNILGQTEESCHENNNQKGNFSRLSASLMNNQLYFAKTRYVLRFSQARCLNRS